jgi:AcrR family transcriptional regulator
MTSADPRQGAGPSRRPRRTDAQRNGELLLEAAREVFEERGVSAALDEIARRAGVGNATMYRHFPTRQELIVAVYAEEVTALRTLGADLITDPAPGAALFRWLRAFVAHVASKRELALAVADDDAGHRSALYESWHASMHTTAAALLQRAQSDGAVAADLRVGDLLALANAVAVAGTDVEHAQRLLDLARYGLARHGPKSKTGREQL